MSDKINTPDTPRPSKGDTGTHTDPRTSERTPVKVTEDVPPGGTKVKVVPAKAPNASPKAVPLKEFEADEP